PVFFFFFSSRRRHTRFSRDWSSDVCSSDLEYLLFKLLEAQLLLSSDQAAFVPIAMAEIESVLRRIREEEERREELVSLLAQDWGVPPHELKLAYLTEHAPDPYRA